MSKDRQHMGRPMFAIPALTFGNSELLMVYQVNTGRDQRERSTWLSAGTKRKQDRLPEISPESPYEIFLNQNTIMNTRTQASLYLDNVREVESLRERFNPFQAQLIPAHVTLCREDETEHWDALCGRIQVLSPFELTLEFGAPIRDGHFVYLPVLDGQDEFHRLRCALLNPPVRRQDPHLTLIHPRNGTCDEATFAIIQKSLRPFQQTFRQIHVIQQTEGGVWQIRNRIDTLTGQITHSGTKLSD